MAIADSRLLASCHRFAWLAAGALMTVAAGALLGWAADIEVLRSIVPGLIAMNPVTAVAFVLAGMSLLWSGGPGPRRSRVALVCAVVVALIGAARLLGYLTAFDPGLDRLLFSDQVGGNVMAPNTALNLCIDGVALALLALGVAISVAQFLAMAAAAIAFMALLGYLFDVALIGLPGYMPMALNSALCFLAVEMGMLASSAEQGPVSALVSRLSGGRVARPLVPAAVLLPVVMGWLILLGVRKHGFSPEFAMALLVTGCVIGMLGLIIFSAGWLNAGDAEIERLLTTDPLTGLLNRRALMEALGNETAAALRYRMPLATAMIDLDHFKLINDTHGHAVGDKVLRELGQLIESTLRETDVGGRYGGEEFVIVLPHTDADGALVFGERLRQRIAAMEVDAGHGKTLKVTCSIGISQMMITETPQPEQALAHADAALYKAKREGRNRVEMAELPAAPKPLAPGRLAEVAGGASPAVR